MSEQLPPKTREMLFGKDPNLQSNENTVQVREGPESDDDEAGIADLLEAMFPEEN